MTTKTFFILHGEDSFSLDQEVAAMRARMGDDVNAELNTSTYDGAVVSAAEILNAARSYPFLSDKRLILVRDMLGWITRKGAGETGKKAVEDIATAVPDLPEWTRLVFIEREALSDSNKLLKLARELPNGFERAFAPPKDSTDWIIRRARDAYQTAIEPQAAQALASIVGGDLRRADSEVDKLASYVAGGRPISEADVALLTPYAAEAGIFELVDAMAEGRSQRALSLLHRLLLQEDEDPFKTYGMIVRQFRLLLIAKEKALTGGDMTLPGVKYKADKFFKQARVFSIAELEHIVRALHDYDFQMKTGQIKAELALDLLIAGLGAR